MADPHGAEEPFGVPQPSQSVEDAIQPTLFVEDIGLNIRAYNILKRARVDTVDQLVRISEDELGQMYGMSTTLLDHIKDQLALHKHRLLFRTRVDRIASDVWTRR